MNSTAAAGISYYLSKCYMLLNVLLITILFFSKTVHRCILCSTQSNCCSTKLNFLSPELWPLTVQKLTPLTTKFREPYSNVSFSRDLQLSQQLLEVWQFSSTSFELKDAIFVLLHSPCSVEALLSCGGKIQYRLIAYFLRNI